MATSTEASDSTAAPARTRGTLLSVLVVLALGAVAAVAAFVAAGWFAGPRPDAALGARLAAAAEEPAGHVLRVADSTDFAWERLHVFGPYSSAETIEAELGFAWHGVADTDIEWNEGIALLVFVADGAVVRHVVQGRRAGDFAELSGEGPFTPASAVFVLRVEDDLGEPWRVWRPTTR